MKPVRKVMFPVAGMGTRFLPATKAVPKELFPIVDKPLIQYGIEEAVEAGGEDMVFITSRHKHAICDHFDVHPELEARLEAKGKVEELARVRGAMPEHVSQCHIPQGEALGLGHAVLCGKDAIGDEPFGVILPDDLIVNDGAGALRQMVDVYRATGCSVIAVEEVDPNETHRYGIVSTSPHGERTEKMEGIVEKPAPGTAPTNLAVVGRYVLTPRIFAVLAETPTGAGGEYQLTDAIANLLAHETVLCYRFAGTRYDCGSKLGFAQATVALTLADPSFGQHFAAYLRTVVDGLGGGA